MYKNKRAKYKNRKLTRKKNKVFRKNTRRGRRKSIKQKKKVINKKTRRRRRQKQKGGSKRAAAWLPDRDVDGDGDVVMDPMDEIENWSYGLTKFKSVIVRMNMYNSLFLQRKSSYIDKLTTLFQQSQDLQIIKRIELLIKIQTEKHKKFMEIMERHQNFIAKMNSKFAKYYHDLNRRNWDSVRVNFGEYKREYSTLVDWIKSVSVLISTDRLVEISRDDLSDIYRKLYEGNVRQAAHAAMRSNFGRDVVMSDKDAYLSLYVSHMTSNNLGLEQLTLDFGNMSLGVPKKSKTDEAEAEKHALDKGKEKAEAEATRLKAEAERAARLKAEAERAARLKAEAEKGRAARLKAEAETAARLKAEAAETAARLTAEAETAARLKAEAAERARKAEARARAAIQKAEAERARRAKEEAEAETAAAKEAERAARLKAEAAERAERARLEQLKAEAVERAERARLEQLKAEEAKQKANFELHIKELIETLKKQDQKQYELTKQVCGTETGVDPSLEEEAKRLKGESATTATSGALAAEDVSKKTIKIIRERVDVYLKNNYFKPNGSTAVSEQRIDAKKALKEERTKTVDIDVLTRIEVGRGIMDDIQKNLDDHNKMEANQANQAIENTCWNTGLE